MARIISKPALLVLAGIAAACAPVNDPCDLPPGQPTFSAIRTTILEPRCISCHGTSGGVSFESYSDAVSQVVPGDADQSRLYIALIDGVMPPSGNICQGEITQIRDWINLGAPDN